MDRIIIGVTFVLGVVIILVAIVSLFRRPLQGEAHLKLAGLELSGSTPTIVFLLVGAALMWATFGWASSRNQVTAITREAAQLNDSVQQQLRANAALSRAVQPETLARMRAEQPLVVNPPVYQPSAVLQERIARLRPSS